MILNGKLGNSTKTGMEWEAQTDFKHILSNKYKISVDNGELIDLENGEHLGIFSVPKNNLYVHLKEVYNINWKDFLCKRINGDEVIINNHSKDVFVIEKKTQKCDGSVDEKLQTCDYKKKQLQKIFSSIGFTVHYIYLLNDWFKQSQYKDVIEYIESVGCEVFFNKINDVRMSKILYIPSN